MCSLGACLKMASIFVRFVSSPYMNSRSTRPSQTQRDSPQSRQRSSKPAPKHRNIVIGLENRHPCMARSLFRSFKSSALNSY